MRLSARDRRRTTGKIPRWVRDHEHDPSSDLSDKSFIEILAKVREQGGVAIAAHVSNAKGLFEVLSGQARIRLWQDENLSAIQIPGPVEDLLPEVRQIVENRNPDYRRAHAAEEGLAVAVVHAKDIVKPEDLDDVSATCWIKMSEVSIEGLRQAFLDPGSRIRLNPKQGKLEPEEHAEFVGLAWEGGFLDGAAIHFNPNLNVLVESTICGCERGGKSGARSANRSWSIQSFSMAASGIRPPSPGFSCSAETPSATSHSRGSTLPRMTVP